MNIKTFFKKALFDGFQTYHGAPKTFDKTGFIAWEELNIAKGVNFPEREPKNYTVRNQSWSGSCVDQTIAKMFEIWDFVYDKVLTVYSATPGYQKRSNAPQPGRIGTEAMDWPMVNGSWLESDVPSQNMSDQQMDSGYVDLNKKQKVKPNKKVLIPIDFYKVAQQIQENNCVMIWIKCGMSEWQQDIPTGNSNSEAVRHSVTGVDCISYKGIEYIVIEDSWGKWLKSADVPLKEGQRAITKEFFDKHCYFAGTFTEFQYEENPNFKHNFKTILVQGDSGEEVKMLQKALQADGFFPVNQKTTGYYGEITRKAVFNFQVRYNVAPMGELYALRGVRVGSKTLLTLNKVFNK